MKRLPTDPVMQDAWQQLLTHALGQKQVGVLGGLSLLALTALGFLLGGGA